jgi:hypothetical protein
MDWTGLEFHPIADAFPLLSSLATLFGSGRVRTTDWEH